MEVYQDQWVKGKVVDKGVRQCDTRFEALRPLLAAYERPFTVLDLGANLGYFSFRIAEEFPLATVVAIEDDSRMWYQCLANDQRVIFLEKRITEPELATLSMCEQFDVVLALNVVHHFKDWRSVLLSLMQMGDHLVIETPDPHETMAINASAAFEIYFNLLQRNHKLITETPSHIGPSDRPMWYFATPHNTLQQSYFTAPDDLELGRVDFESDFKRRRVFLHRKGEHRDWIPGINLQTYLSLNGRWPEQGRLADAIAVMHPQHHGDVRTWNFVLNREGLHLIDGRDDRAVDKKDDFQAVADTVRRA